MIYLNNITQLYLIEEKKFSKQKKKMSFECKLVFEQF